MFGMEHRPNLRIHARMTPTLCILGGCNGAGKTTLVRELLPRLGLMRFLNAG